MLIDMKSRADWQVDATREASSGSTPILPPLVTLGRVRLNLGATQTGDRWHDWARETTEEVTRMIRTLTLAPAGCEVVLQVAPGQIPEGIAHLRDQGQHLGPITVECSDPETVRRWVLALRGGTGW